MLNPQWREIQESLRPGQTALDRYDIVCRVFHLKVASLFADLRANVLGKQVAHMHVVEWQKRGLPHVHLLLWLAEGDKMRSPTDYDDVVCAQIPDPVKEPRLHALLMQYMIHVPCRGTADFKKRPLCLLADGKCKAGFPKARQMRTIEDGQGYTLYARPKLRWYVYPGTCELMDDGSVVAYPPLLLRYETHCNVEVFSTLHAVKYLHKYIHKGGDRAMTALENPRTVVESLDAHPDVPAVNPDGPPQPPAEDEIRRYLEGRYISTGEAVWRALEFETHAIEGSVSGGKRFCCVCFGFRLRFETRGVNVHLS